MSPGRWTIGLGAAAFALVLDQVTKWLMVTVVMNPPRLIPLTPFFNLTLGLNTGVSFGLFADGRPWLLVLLALTITALLLLWLRRVTSRVEMVAIGCIVGGALGNTLDRLRLGGVVDFLDFHAAGWHWPAFNLADSAIVLGAAILMGQGLLAQGRPMGSREGERA